MLQIVLSIICIQIQAQGRCGLNQKTLQTIEDTREKTNLEVLLIVNDFCLYLLL